MAFDFPVDIQDSLYNMSDHPFSNMARYVGVLGNTQIDSQQRYLKFRSQWIVFDPSMRALDLLRKIMSDAVLLVDFGEYPPFITLLHEAFAKHEQSQGGEGGVHTSQEIIEQINQFLKSLPTLIAESHKTASSLARSEAEGNAAASSLARLEAERNAAAIVRACAEAESNAAASSLACSDFQDLNLQLTRMASGMTQIRSRLRVLPFEVKRTTRHLSRIS